MSAPIRRMAPEVRAAPPQTRAARQAAAARQLNLFQPAPTLFRFGAQSAFQRAVAAHERGSLDEAAAAYRDAAVAGSRAGDAWTNLGVLEWQRGNRVEAVDATWRATLAETTHAYAHYNLGLMLTDLGEWQAGCLHLRTAARRGLDTPDLWGSLTVVAAGVGLYEEAEHARLAYERAVGRPPNGDEGALVTVV